MAKEQENNCLDTFAWLIHKEVEQYVNEHLDEYKEWLSSQKDVSSDTDKTLNDD